ncbi:MAG: outer membrane beta-barrel protein [Tatlockia sp.]|nr:outer membrane beta-barrel protein [Tatlockia sp.]
MSIKKISRFSFLPLFFYSLLCFGNEGSSLAINSAFYLGFLGGYGSTTWNGLVPNNLDQNLALSLSTPIKATEGGGVWGFIAGHEFIPALALELSYMNYPQAKLLFDETSLFSFDHDNLTILETKTETVSLMAKIMLPISTTSFRVYSSAGAAGVHRKDMLLNDWRLSPTFGLGLNYQFTRHLMAELGGNYTAGYGESQLSPTESYFPFLYSITARLAYRF